MALRIIRLPVVKDRTGSSTSDIYAGMKTGTFPKSVPIGVRTVGWLESEIDQWIEGRVAARDNQPKRKGGPGRPRAHEKAPTAKAGAVISTETLARVSKSIEHDEYNESIPHPQAR